MSTKIINVQKEDRIEEILELFKKSPSKEVIFILPKKHEVFSSPDHFVALASVAGEAEKNPLILSSNQDIIDLAFEHNIGVLTSAKTTKSAPKKKTKTTEKAKPTESKSEPEEIVQEVLDDRLSTLPVSPELNNAREDVSSVSEDDSKISLEPNQPDKMMFDIVQPQNEDEDTHNVDIEAGENESIDVGINKDIQVDKLQKPSPVDDIQSVWQRPSSYQMNLNRKNIGNDNNSSRPPFAMSGFRIDSPFLKFFRKPLFLFGVLVFVVFGVVVYISTGSAKVIVKPKSHLLDFSIKVATSDKFNEVNLEKKEIPGQLFSITKKVEETFKATGEKEVVQKARGKITVYNEYGTTPQTLIATTRFESSEGLVFRTLKTIIIPGTKVENGKIIPGSIEVEVVADKAGENYNISPGKFTLPAFKERGDSDRYQKFYGESSEAMKGGIIGKSKVVTETDYLDAKSKIQDKIIAEAKQGLEAEASGLKIVDLPSVNVGDINVSAQIDEAIDQFIASGEANVNSVGFKESDLYELISRYVREINDVVILPEKLEIVYDSPEFSVEDGILKFNMTVKGSAYDNINKEKLIEDLVNKDEMSIKDYIKGVEGISSIRVVLSPFWVRKVPKDINRINLEMQYD